MIRIGNLERQAKSKAMEIFSLRQPTLASRK